MPSHAFQVQANDELVIIFRLIDTSGNLVSGEAANVVSTLRDQDGAAAESVTITEQGSSGFYEAALTPTKSDANGHTYLLGLQSPVPATDGALLEYTLRVFPSISVSGVTGSYLTTLAHVKEFMGITSSTHDTLLTNLVARISRMIEAWLGRTFVEASYVEIHDGQYRSSIVLRNYPVSAVSKLYQSLDQTWDASTEIAAGDFIRDDRLGRIWLKDGAVFYSGFQNVRVEYTAGYATIPLDVEQVAVEMVARSFKERDDIHLISRSLKDGSFTKKLANRFFADLLQDLAPYIATDYV